MSSHIHHYEVAYVDHDGRQTRAVRFGRDQLDEARGLVLADQPKGASGWTIWAHRVLRDGRYEFEEGGESPGLHESRGQS